MAYTSKRKSTKRPLKRTPYKKRKMSRPVNIRKIVKQVLNKNVETKRSCTTSTDGAEIFHNNFIDLDANVLSTLQGVDDPMTNAINNRIGDEIMLKGVSIKCMFELNERYSDVTFRMMVLRCAKGDIPTRATLFAGLSGNKMLDTINSERYTVMAQKYFKIMAPNNATIGNLAAVGSGLYSTGAVASDPVLSRATKIVKLWVPGAKFGKGGKIVYENGTAQVKFFDYRVLVYAYSNFGTLQDIWYVARCNDYVRQIFYKDA